MKLRPATILDCADIAILDDMAGRGLPLWLWQCAVERGDTDNALEWGRSTYTGDVGKAVWPEIIIGEVDNEVAGMVWAYKMTRERANKVLDEPIFKPIGALREQTIGTFYIDAIAVYKRFRGKGIARQLMKCAYEQAKDLPITLIAADDNTNAIGLYQSEKFTETARETFVPYAPSNKTQNWLLMTQDADPQIDEEAKHG